MVQRTLTIAPDDDGVLAARDRYLAENGFTVASYSDDWAKLSFLGIPIEIPNTEGRKRALPKHDLHHVALGFGTDLAGECEISAWELRAGFDDLGWFVRYLVIQAVALGLFVAPKRTVRAWRMGGTQRSLYRAPIPQEAIAQMTVGELRDHLNVPRGGIAACPAAIHGRP
jgi:hypothetical protein